MPGSITEPGIHVGAVNGRVATGRPAGSHLEKLAVIRVPNINASGCHAGSLNLRVATQAEIGVAGDEHFLVDRAVRIVTSRAPFPQCLMLEDKRPRLLPVTLRAAFILPRHGQAARRLENVTAVRIVTLHATHVPFHDRMMLRQVEFRLNIQMTLKTRGRVVPRINDKFCPAGFDVLAAGTMAGFAARLPGQGRIFKMHAGMRAGGKFPDNVRMTIQACMVTDEMGAGYFQRHAHAARGA